MTVMQWIIVIVTAVIVGPMLAAAAHILSDALRLPRGWPERRDYLFFAGVLMVLGVMVFTAGSLLMGMAA